MFRVSSVTTRVGKGPVAACAAARPFWDGWLSMTTISIVRPRALVCPCTDLSVSISPAGRS